MVDLNEDNDPMLFCVGVPAGKLIVQYLEVVAQITTKSQSDQNPTPAEIVAAIRETSRTPDIAQACTDAILLAAWFRIAQAADKAGKA